MLACLRPPISWSKALKGVLPCGTTAHKGDASGWREGAVGGERSSKAAAAAAAAASSTPETELEESTA